MYFPDSMPPRLHLAVYIHKPRLAGSFKLQVSFAKEPCKRDDKIDFQYQSQQAYQLHGIYDQCSFSCYPMCIWLYTYIQRKRISTNKSSDCNLLTQARLHLSHKFACLREGQDGRARARRQSDAVPQLCFIGLFCKRALQKTLHQNGGVRRWVCVPSRACACD